MRPSYLLWCNPYTKSRYRDFHHKDKMVMRPSYLYNVNPYTNSRYRDFLYKDKMVMRPSYLYNVNPYTNSRYRNFHYNDKMLMRPSYLYNINPYTLVRWDLYIEKISCFSSQRPSNAEVKWLSRCVLKNTKTESCHDANFVVTSSTIFCCLTTSHTTNDHNITIMKILGFHDANFVIIGSTKDCHNNNLWCHEWQQSWHDDNSQFSV